MSKTVELVEGRSQTFVITIGARVTAYDGGSVEIELAEPDFITVDNPKVVSEFLGAETWTSKSCACSSHPSSD